MGAPWPTASRTESITISSPEKSLPVINKNKCISRQPHKIRQTGAKMWIDDACIPELILMCLQVSSRTVRMMHWTRYSTVYGIFERCFLYWVHDPFLNAKNHWIMIQGRKPETVNCNDLIRKDLLHNPTLQTEINHKINCQILIFDPSCKLAPFYLFSSSPPSSLVNFEEKPTFRVWWLFIDTGCDRYCRPFCDTNINLHKIFKNNNRLMKFSGIVYLYLDFTFSGWNRL